MKLVRDNLAQAMISWHPRQPTWALGLAAVSLLAAAVVLVMLGLSVLGLASGFAGHEWTVPDVIGLVLILSAFILLVSKPSLRAYWRHGRLVWKKPAAPPGSAQVGSVD